jgi:CMP-N,N'-diacetyllegionaminic acid synthase
VEDETVSVPAIILARSGSKGCPDKNKRVIAGRMCFEWSVLDAQAADCEVIVTSDDTEILARAVTIGAKVVLRPSELATDTATVQDSVRHACHAKGIDGPVVVLYGCVPVRPKHMISAALAVLESTGADSVQSYAPVGKCHPWWMVCLGKDGEVVSGGDVVFVAGSEGAFVNGEHATITATTKTTPHRRQDLLPMWIPDGGVIVLRDPAKFFGDTRQSITTRPGDVIDIDTDHDAMVAGCVLDARSGVAQLDAYVGAIRRLDGAKA